MIYFFFSNFYKILKILFMEKKNILELSSRILNKK